MRISLLTSTILFLAMTVMAQGVADKTSPRLQQALAGEAEVMRQDDGSWAVWVHFSDKGVADSDLESALAVTEAQLSARTLNRRAKMKRPGERLVGTGDLPLEADYLSILENLGAEPRHQSRWLNAASFNASEDQIAAIVALPFVDKIDLVARFIRPTPDVAVSSTIAADQVRRQARDAAEDRWTLSYGGSTAGLEQINVPPAHEIGLTGAGVVIGMLDGGFRTTHGALQGVTIIDQWDFVGNDPIVDEEEGDAQNAARHGTHTLSTIMGYREGELVGPAFGASVILARTEDAGDETPIEEDNFIAGLEWVESLGADLVSSSLGYYYWYEFSDMDGNTALCTIACDEAAARGLCVVNCAGNQRGNEDWPHLVAPADGHEVITIGAVNLAGECAPFSSPGPTYDGRIKPDVTAQGVGNYVASYYDPDSYTSVNGTSFSTPLTAGAVALLLERVPSLTPLQVREALRATADNTNRPDNDYGWGVVNTMAAVNYWGPAIEHDPYPNTENNAGPYELTANVTSRQDLDMGSLALSWRGNGGAWNQQALVPLGDDVYGATIPGLVDGGLVEYYFEAADVSGITITLPHGAPERSFAFEVGVDGEAPRLEHAYLIDQVPGLWPPMVSALATDNIAIDRVEMTYAHNGSGEQGPFMLIPAADGLFELPFPASGVSIQPGDGFSYTITAWDVAGTPNRTDSGPHEFNVVASLGEVLIVDANPRTADDMAQWVSGAGYSVDVIADSEVVGDSFLGYDVVVVTCGNNGTPLNSESLRTYLIEWAEAGGRIFIESGHLGKNALHIPGFPEFAAKVLHAAEWWGDSVGTRDYYPPSDASDHFFLKRPYRLPSPVTMEMPEGVADLWGGDLMLGAEDAQVILHSIYNASSGGVLLHDDNTGHEAGQIVYLTFDIAYMASDLAAPFVANSLAYLTSRELPGNASISGVVVLGDDDDASGVTVSIDADHQVVTGPDGHYTLDGLHGSVYEVSAAIDGYGPVIHTVTLMADESVTGVDFVLQPVQEFHETVSPDLAIPDNDADGIDSVITVGTQGNLQDISIDIGITHASIGNLIVTLTSPAGTVVTLHHRSGGTSDDLVGNWPVTLSVDGPGDLGDFQGESVAGDWVLNVADRQFGGWGTLNSWGLNLLIGAPVTAVDEDLPVATGLVGNAPNPFNPQTVISFDLAQDGPVRLDIFDVRGRRVLELQSGVMAAGRHRVAWNGRDGAGREMASGIYFARLAGGGHTHLHKMMLVR